MKLDSIVVVGGGTSGWMTASTLVRAYPNKKITVIESKDVPTIGVGESTVGGIRKWAQYVGLRDETFFAKTDATIKMSIKFNDFYKKDSGGFHYPFGYPMKDRERNPFADWHLKKYFYPKTTVEDLVRCLFPASALFETDKYSENLNGEFDNFNPNDDIAYHFDAAKFGLYLRDEYCIPKGVKHIVGTVVSITQDEDGITGLVTDSGETLVADLYVDCTGFKSLLLGGALEEPFTPYSDLLPNNRAWAAQIPHKNPDAEVQGFTNCTAIENGWCWNTPLFSRIGAGYVYSDKFVDPETAKEEFKQYLMSDKMVVPRTREEVDSFKYNDVPFKVGMYERTFVKNVVAIGLSAAFIEPLESNALYSVHEFLFYLIDTLSRGEISQWDRDMYNTSTKKAFDGFAKFVALHYALSHRDDTPYWKALLNKNYVDKQGNSYFPSVDKVDYFWDMNYRYMHAWYHPEGQGGNTYIATGLHLDMITEYRFLNIQKEQGRDVRKENSEIVASWEDRKNKWAKNALEAPTLRQYLQGKFYTKEQNV
jgi:tryptophan halogenase